MKRGYSCKLEEKHQFKKQQYKFDPATVYANDFGQLVVPQNYSNRGKLLTPEQQKMYKKYQEQKAPQNKEIQNNNQKKKDNKNPATIFLSQRDFLMKSFQKNIQKKDMKEQQQRIIRNHLQLKKQTKFAFNDKLNQKSQQESPKYQKPESNSRHSKQMQQSPQIDLNSSMILLAKNPVSPIEDRNQNEQNSIFINQSPNESKVLQKIDDYTDREILIRLERLMSKQKEQLQAEQMKQRQAFKSIISSLLQQQYNKISSQLKQELKKQNRCEHKKQLQAQLARQRQALKSIISSQFQSQYTKICNQLSTLKQTIKKQNRTSLVNNSESLPKNEKPDLQIVSQQYKKENIELRAELKRRDVLYKQNEEKILQKYIQMKKAYETQIKEKYGSQMKEEYESQIRRMNDQHQKQIQNLKSQFQQQRRQKKQLLNMEKQQPRDIISSNLLNFSSIQHAKSFIKKEIEVFQSKSVAIFELLFQKDQRTNNFGVYMDDPMFPFLLLILTQKDTIFGAYSQGFQTIKSRESASQKQKIKAFLFNANNKQIFINDRKTSLNAVQYIDSMLRFGNSEIVIKNNNLQMIKVNANNILGECYYTIKNRRYLTGQEGDQIKIKRMQIHKVYFQRE